MLLSSSSTLTQLHASIAIAASLWLLRRKARLQRLRALLGWGMPRPAPSLPQGMPGLAVEPPPPAYFNRRTRPRKAMAAWLPAGMEVVEANDDAAWQAWEVASGWGDVDPAQDTRQRP